MHPETISKAIDHAIQILSTGGVILYPADTIWGIGCDATHKEAISRIFDIKGRNAMKPLIVLVPTIEDVYQIAASVHPRIDTLLHFHERPLTVIYPSPTRPYSHLAAANGTIAVRVVKSGFCHDLLTAYGKPLVSTSANKAGDPSPTKFGSVSTVIISQVDYALPAFTEKDITGSPSVIARYDENGELEFLR